MKKPLTARPPLAVFGALLLGLAIGGPACREMPRDDWARLLQVRSDLVEVGAEALFPEKFRSFDLELYKARMVWARAEASFLPDTEALKTEIRQLSARGEALKEESLRVRRDLQAEQERQLRVLSEGVQSWSGNTLDPSLRRTIAKLELTLEQARGEWRRGRYDRVAELLEGVRGETEHVKSHFMALQRRYHDPDQKRAWRRWIDATVAESRKGSSAAVVVDKLRGRVTLYQGGLQTADFPADLGWNWLLDKLRQGDGATPEGRYRVVRKKGPGQTKYGLALLLDYPNQDDLRRFRRAKRSGSIAGHAGIGGLIEIHGDGGRGSNWTQGCVALDNEDMRQLFDLASVGMPVTIVGTVPD